MSIRKPPYRICFPYGGLSFAENVAVRPGAGQRQHQNIIVNAVDQQPVRLDMTFPMSYPIS